MTAATQAPPAPAGSVSTTQRVALVDLLDRLLGAGVMLSGDITISLSGVDLVHIRLHALLASAGAMLPEQP